MSIFLIAALALAIIVGLVLVFWWMPKTYQGRLFLYKLWKTNSLAKSKIPEVEGTWAGWTKSAKHLGQDFVEFIPAMDVEHFKAMDTYLKKSGQTERTPMPMWVVIGLFILVAAEALGFSYLLSTWIAMEGSQDILLLMTAAIVIVICLIMVAITHTAGHQLYATNFYKKFRREWEEDPKPTKGAFRSGPVSLNDDQASDDGQPHYTHVANRVDEKNSYFMMYVAIAAIVVIASLSTYMRVEHLKAVQTEESMGASKVVDPYANGGAGMPAEVTDANRKVDTEGAETIRKSNKDAGIAAFVFLAFIFIFTQIVGIFSGYNWGFINKNAKLAYLGTKGFSRFSEVERFQDIFIEPVEALMTKLHTAMKDGNSIGRSNTFRNYLKISNMERRQAREEHKAPPPPPPPPPAAPPAPPPTPPVAQTPASGHLGAIDGLSSKEEKEKYLFGLPSSERDLVIEQIKNRKLAQAAAEEEKKRAVSGLFD